MEDKDLLGWWTLFGTTPNQEPKAQKHMLRGLRGNTPLFEKIGATIWHTNEYPSGTTVDVEVIAKKLGYLHNDAVEEDGYALYEAANGTRFLYGGGNAYLAATLVLYDPEKHGEDIRPY